MNSLQHAPIGIRNVINDALFFYNEDIFMTRTVKETIWGYVDPSLATLVKLHSKWFYTDYVGYFINVRKLHLENIWLTSESYPPGFSKFYNE